MSALNNVPGVTLHLKKAERAQTFAVITLTATVPDDEEVWRAVLTRINGHRLLANPSLQREAFDLLESDYKARISELEEQLEQQRNELEALRAELSYSHR